MLRYYRRIFQIIVAMTSILSGCGTNYFYNTNYPSAQQQSYFNRDSAQCTNYAQGLSPMPQISYIDNGPKRTIGTINLSDGRRSYSGNYSTYTYSTDFTASFVNGLNIGNALTTPFREENIQNNCLASLGWHMTKHKYDVPPPEGNENVKIMIKNLTQNGFVNTRYVNGVYYMIRSIINEGDTVKMIVADIHPYGKTSADKFFMYGIASWVIMGKKVAFINEYSAYDINNDKVLYDTAKTNNFLIKDGSMLHIYLLDYDLI